MRIVITGGSNTLLGGGWRPHFEALLPEGTSVTNLAIGGTTSVMGLFRLLTQGNIQPGDIVLWEYALNEHGHYRNGHKLPVLMSHVEALIRLVAEKGGRLLPIIFTTKVQEVKREFDAYRAQLHFTFATHDVDYMDISQTFRAKLNVPRFPEEMFQDNFHYLPNGEIVQGLAEMVAQRLPQIRETTFHGDRAMLVDPRRRIVAVDAFPGAESVEFKTGIIRTQTFPFDQELEVKVHGRLLAAVLVSAPAGEGFALSVGGEEIGAFATRRAYEERGPRRIVKQISFHALLGKPVACFNKPVVLRRPEPGATLIADHTYEADAGMGTVKDEDALIGLLADQMIERG